MNRLAELKNKRRKEQRKQHWLKPVLICLWLLAIASFFYTLDELGDTLVSYKIPLLTGGLFGLIVAVFFIKDKDIFLVTVLCFGALFIAIPLLINDIFAESQVIELKQMVNVKNHRHRRSGPSVEIKYGDLEKKIDVDSETEMDSSSYIVLKVNKGLFGYYIIRDKKLVKE